MRRLWTSPVVIIATLIGTSCGTSAPAAPLASAASAPTPPGCAPTPCATAGGLTVRVTTVVAPFSPSLVAGVTPDPTVHLIRVDLLATARSTTLLPATSFHLGRSDGPLAPVDTIDGGEDCQSIGAGITAVPLPPTPTPLCFDIADATFSGFRLLVDLPTGGQLAIPLSA
jgi:hypothetical protein